MKRGKRVNARSAKRARVYAEERVPLVEHLLRRYPRCQMRVRCSGAAAVDVHEILSRARGGSITDPVNCLTACRTCHDWVTTHDAQAACLGFTLPSWAPTSHDSPWAAAQALREAYWAGKPLPCPWRRLEGCTSLWDAQERACDRSASVDSPVTLG